MGKLDNTELISTDLPPTDGSFPFQQLFPFLNSFVILQFVLFNFL